MKFDEGRKVQSALSEEEALVFDPGSLSEFSIETPAGPPNPDAATGMENHTTSQRRVGTNGFERRTPLRINLLPRRTPIAKLIEGCKGALNSLIVDRTGVAQTAKDPLTPVPPRPAPVRINLLPRRSPVRDFFKRAISCLSPR